MQIIITTTITIFMILSLASLGGVFSERAGVINIAIEGMMIAGALAYAISGAYLSKSGNGMQFLSLVIAMGVGMFIALLHAFVCVTLKGDQVISGIAINMLLGGFALYAINGLHIGEYVGSISSGYIDINFAKTGFWSHVSVMILVVIGLLIIGYLLLAKTKWGSKVRAVGENPHAVAALGMNVQRIRYQSIAVAGAFAGAGGAMFIVMTKTFSGGVNGYGFVALAIMIFGQWKVKWVTAGAIIFAVLNALALQAPFINLGFISNIPKELLNTIPFVVSIIILMLTSKKTRAPKALGVVYNSTH